MITVSRLRCTVVASALLSGGAAAGWGLARELTVPVATVEDAVVRLCLALLVGCTLWATASGLAAVAEAWRGAPRPGARRGAWRRLVLAACGVAVAVSCTAVAGAAHADPPADPLDGLPLPERATDGPPPATLERLVVRPGDTLWSLAAARLPAGASAAAIDLGWHRIYRVNRAALGPDPDLIHPGQVLDLPRTQENR